MALNTSTQAEIALKHLLGKSQTASSATKGPNNEAEAISLINNSTNIWITEINSTPSTAVSSGVAEYVVADLTLDNTSSGQAFFATYPTGHPKQGLRVVNTIPPSYGFLYEAKPYAGGTLIPPGDSRDWLYQYQSGIFYQQTANASPTPTTIQLYVYKGQTLFDVFTGLTINGSISANSFIVSGGTSNQFLKGNGSLDSNQYLLNSSDISSLSYNQSTGIITITKINGSTLTGGTFTYITSVSSNQNTISFTPNIGSVVSFTPQNIYNSNGTLSENRTVTQTNNTLTFVGGTMFVNEKLQQGVNVFANGTGSHAEGRNTIANGNYSHAEGFSVITTNQYSHAEGRQTQSNADYSHTEGYQTITTGQFSHAEGRSGTTIGQGSHVEGFNSKTFNQYSHAEGRETITYGDYSHAEGYLTQTNNIYSHAEGRETNASGNSSHAEGRETVANGGYSHVEGYLTQTNNDYSHAEGRETNASGTYSHTEGFKTITSISADGGHAEGDQTQVNAKFGHTEGRQTQVNASYGHAEGDETNASGYGSHAEGRKTVASGDYSHAEGQDTIANNSYSHVQGLGTISNRNHQFVMGRYNESNSTSLGVIGNGTNDSNRHDLVRFDITGVTINNNLTLPDVNISTDTNLLTVDNNGETHKRTISSILFMQNQTNPNTTDIISSHQSIFNPSNLTILSDSIFIIENNAEYYVLGDLINNGILNVNGTLKIGGILFNNGTINNTGIIQ
jgi:hypothetical protein